MKAAEFDFYLPEELIAKKPVEKRDASRLLVLHKDGKTEHRRFYDMPEYLNKGDILLLNNTKVFPARLTGTKPTGGKIEFLLVKETGPNTWEILSRKKFKGKVSISEELSAEINGTTAYFPNSGDFMDMLWKYGDMPLPPYIKRRPVQKDKEWYQTTYAEKEGSIAAPTAGLHFTEELISKIKAKGVNVRYLTLHVGTGTFRPIRAEKVEEHSMDAEYFEADNNIVKDIKKAKASNNKVVSVGTTTTRAIEGYFSNQFSVVGRRRNGAVSGSTDIFIYPGYSFKAVDSLITNFHLPRSTPLLLASARCSRERLLEAYNSAITHKYRFFSYGDAMLIL